MKRFATAAIILLPSLSLACNRDVSVQLLAGEGARGVPALRFAGPYDHVEIPSSPLLDVPRDFALEAWVFVDGYAGGHGIFNRWQSGVGDLELTFGVPEALPTAELGSGDPVPSHTLAAWGFVSTGHWISAYSRALPSPREWHHLAVSYGGGSLKLYVDGSRWATAAGTEPIASAPTSVFIGATARTEQPGAADAGRPWWAPMQGAIADVRLSSSNRYPDEFIPQRHLTPDDATLALWHLDEGADSVAFDSGPHHLDGAIVGAAWSPLPSR